MRGREHTGRKAPWVMRLVAGAGFLCTVSGPTMAAPAAAVGTAATWAAAPSTPPLLPRPSLEVLAAMQASPVPLPEPTTSVPSLKWALLLSAAVPGAGEYYAGHKNRALIFGTVEAGIWISYATFKVQENGRQESAIDYAVAVAGAVPEGDDAYYTAIGQFLRSDGPGQWNEFVRRQQRDSGEVVGVEYTGDAGWAWPSEDQFVRYRDLRKGSLEAEDHATNMLAVAIVNRIASMADVFQAMRHDAKHREAEGFGLHLRLGRTPREPLACLLLQRRF